jgi:hypothetical protein
LHISLASVSSLPLLFSTASRSIITDKSIQSAGGAGVWRADGARVPWVLSFAWLACH